MGVGARIQRLRRASGRTQRSVAAAAGLAGPYLSRLENGRVTPTLRTLSRVAEALGVPTAALLETQGPLEPPDRCPVSLSGRCILDHPAAGPGRRVGGGERYSAEQIRLLRLVNVLMQAADAEIQRALATLLGSLLALAERRSAGAATESVPAPSVAGRIP